MCFSGFQSHCHKWGSPGAERPVPKPSQSDDTVFNSCTHWAESGAPRRFSEFLQPQHRPDSHHLEQCSITGSASHPARPCSSRWCPCSPPNQCSPTHSSSTTPQSWDNPPLSRPRTDHCPGNGTPCFYGASGSICGTCGSVHDSADSRDHYESRHHPNGVVPNCKSKHEDHNPATLNDCRGCNTNESNWKCTWILMGFEFLHRWIFFLCMRLRRRLNKERCVIETLRFLHQGSG